MKTVSISDLIRQRRLALNLTQEQLGEGICEPITISRIENNRQMPSPNKLKALLERLGLPQDKYYALLREDEQRIANLQDEILACNVQEDSVRGLELLRELEQLAQPEDTLLRQFILRSRVLLGKLEDGQLRQYSTEERMELLLQAIHLTSPRFDLERIEKGLYSMDEVKVINQIALVYSDMGDHKKAIDIYYQLLRYIKQHFKNILQSGGLLPLVACNYARELGIVGRYKDSVEVAMLGWQACIQHGQYCILPSILSIMAENYHHMGMDNESQEYYKQAYYLYKAIGNFSNLQIIKNDAAKFFGENFAF